MATVFDKVWKKHEIVKEANSKVQSNLVKLRFNRAFINLWQV